MKCCAIRAQAGALVRQEKQIPDGKVRGIAGSMIHKERI